MGETDTQERLSSSTSFPTSLAKMMMKSMKPQCVATPKSVANSRIGAPQKPRKAVVTRADLGDQIKEKTKDLVEETKKNSGLDEKVLSNQAGNNPSQTFGTTDVKTGQGQSVAEAFSPSGGPGGITSLVEITNGRAAMLAMLAAFGAEVATKKTIFAQIQQAPLLIGATFVTIILASAIPVLRGADLQRNGIGPFTKEAEVLNGRTGMVAFALLILVETWKAGPGLAF